LNGCVGPRKRGLRLDRTPHRIYDAAELGQQAVVGGVGDAAAMRSN
jgi:hypothetical protein